MSSRVSGLKICGSVLLALGLSACGGSGDPLQDLGNAFDYETKPETTTTPSTPTTPVKPVLPVTLASVAAQVTVRTYDGLSDDLVTGGLGQGRLASTPPAAVDSLNPTAAEIRQATLAYQYQGLLDLRSSAGFGRLYGPALPEQGNGGRVAGREYLSYLPNSNTSVLVQIPSRFDPLAACVVAAPSPGSRGVYGAVSTVGAWALKQGCAVTYTDKGTGTGLHDLYSDSVTLIDGTRLTASSAGSRSNFTATGKNALTLASYNSAYPHRVAQKHAHSQSNPERQWGQDTLTAIEFALLVLNRADAYGHLTSLSGDNTLVIAAGWGSAGAAVLRAAEQDSSQLIDGVVAVAPLITPRHPSGFSIQQDNSQWDSSQFDKTLLDAWTYLAIYQPCASANSRVAGAVVGAPGRCTALYQAGLLQESTLTRQISEAQQRLTAYGLLPETQTVAAAYLAADAYLAHSYLYASAYGRFSVVENLCDYSYAASTGNNPPSALSGTALAALFQSASGMPPDSGIHLINNHTNTPNGRAIDVNNSQDTQGNLDRYLAGTRCLRQLATGQSDDGSALNSEQQAWATRVQNGQLDVLATADLRGKPGILVQGRNDSLAPANLTSRAYYGLNQQQTASDKLVYWEIKNAHHQDALAGRYALNAVPLVYYLDTALNALYAHLKRGTALPVSQVIATQLPSNAAPTWQASHLPAPGSLGNCRIDFKGGVLTVPGC